MTHGLDLLTLDLAQLKRDWDAGEVKPAAARRRLRQSLREMNAVTPRNGV